MLLVAAAAAEAATGIIVGVVVVLAVPSGSEQQQILETHSGYCGSMYILPLILCCMYHVASSKHSDCRSHSLGHHPAERSLDYSLAQEVFRALRWTA